MSVHTLLGCVRSLGRHIGTCPVVLEGRLWPASGSLWDSLITSLPCGSRDVRMAHACSPNCELFSSFLHLRASACSVQDTFTSVIAYLPSFVEEAQTALSHLRFTSVREVSPRPPLSLWAAQLCSCVPSCSRLRGAQGGASRKNWWSAQGYVERERLSSLYGCSVYFNMLGSPKPNGLRCRFSCVLSEACNQPSPTWHKPAQ